MEKETALKKFKPKHIPKDILLILEDEFQKSSHWSKQHLSYLSTKLGLSAIKLYKWNWDRLKKEKAKVSK